MTDEERNELNRIRRERGRGKENEHKNEPTYKDEKKVSVWRLKCFGRLIEIKISDSNK